ncbi:MAG: hypothetical protein DHS20C21_00430 [Gemmatimonadota bacterium]|nr:MAG: hypothetical protein DHS20C21_00430 [Gemmatimonadota bacterium]
MVEKKRAKVAKKAPAKRAAAKASAPRKTAPKAKPGKAAAKSSSKGADWRQKTLSRVRELIKKADPDAVEEVKWRKPSNAMAGIPVWSRDGILCTGETYKDKVKLTFAKGAALKDPAGLFNSSLGGNTRRAIDLYEGDELNEKAFTALIRAAAVHNASGKKK